MELIGEIEVSGNSATFSFRGVGSGITRYICKLDGRVLPNCMLAIDSYVPQIREMIQTCPPHRFQSSDWSQYRNSPVESGS